MNGKSGMALQRIVAVLIAVMLAGCASGPTIIRNSDPGTEFMDIRTFDYMRPLSTDLGTTTSLISTHLVTATTAQLERLGMRRVEGNPDVLINFHLATQEKIRTRNTTTSVHMSRGYPGWSGYAVGVSTPTIDQVTEGTLSIDMINVSRNQLVWEGVAIGRITDKVRKNQEAAINSAVQDIFAEFP